MASNNKDGRNNGPKLTFQSDHSAGVGHQAASGTGTVPVSTTTSLSSLGILPGGTLTFGDGSSNTTTYTSTGDDTVGSLINAINNGPAFLNASIDGSGHLTVTARDTKASVVISGSGTDAPAIGFGNNNDTFQPIHPTAKTASSDTSSTSPAASTAPTASTSTSSQTTAVPSVFEESASSAASMLSASGVSGTLVNLLA